MISKTDKKAASFKRKDAGEKTQSEEFEEQLEGQIKGMFPGLGEIKRLKTENTRLKEQIEEKTDWDKQYKDKKKAMKKIRQGKRLYTLDKAPQIPDCVRPALKELGKRWAEHLESCEERFSADWVRLIFGADRN